MVIFSLPALQFPALADTLGKLVINDLKAVAHAQLVKPVAAQAYAGLVSFLDRLAGMEVNSQHRFLVMYLQSHPPTALRVDRLEQMQEVEQAA